jgi:hypothetical protein
MKILLGEFMLERFEWVKISGHQQRWPRPLLGAILIPADIGSVLPAYSGAGLCNPNCPIL